MPASAQERKLAQLDNDVAAIYDIVAKLERGQRRHDARFDRLDARLDGVDARLDGVDARFDRLDARFDGVDARFDRLDARFDGVDAHLGELAEGLATVIDLVSRPSSGGDGNGGR